MIKNFRRSHNASSHTLACKKKLNCKLVVTLTFYWPFGLTRLRISEARQGDTFLKNSLKQTLSTLTWSAYSSQIHIQYCRTVGPNIYMITVNLNLSFQSHLFLSFSINLFLLLFTRTVTKVTAGVRETNDKVSLKLIKNKRVNKKWFFAPNSKMYLHNHIRT